MIRQTRPSTMPKDRTLGVHPYHALTQDRQLTVQILPDPGRSATDRSQNVNL